VRKFIRKIEWPEKIVDGANVRVTLSQGSTLLDVWFVNKTLTLWWEVPENPKIEEIFLYLVAGETVLDDKVPVVYCKTFQDRGGSVYHLYRGFPIPARAVLDTGPRKPVPRPPDPKEEISPVELEVPEPDLKTIAQKREETPEDVSDPKSVWDIEG